MFLPIFSCCSKKANYCLNWRCKNFLLWCNRIKEIQFNSWSCCGFSLTEKIFFKGWMIVIQDRWRLWCQKHNFFCWHFLFSLNLGFRNFSVVLSGTFTLLVSSIFDFYPIATKMVLVFFRPKQLSSSLKPFTSWNCCICEVVLVGQIGQKFQKLIELLFNNCKIQMNDQLNVSKYSKRVRVRGHIKVDRLCHWHMDGKITDSR